MKRSSDEAFPDKSTFSERDSKRAASEATGSTTAPETQIPSDGVDGPGGTAFTEFHEPDGDAAAGPKPEADYYAWQVIASPVRLRRSKPISEETWKEWELVEDHKDAAGPVES
jgi:hypothetical protein